jgi:hypothetical protein
MPPAIRPNPRIVAATCYPRTAATGMADLGILPHVIEAAFNHQGGHKSGVAGIYNKSRYEKQTRAAFAPWQEHVRALVIGGNAVKPRGGV